MTDLPGQRRGLAPEAVHDQLTNGRRRRAAADAKPIESAKDSYKDWTTKQMAESIRHGYKLFSDPSGSASLHRLATRTSAGRSTSSTTSGERSCGRPI